MAISGVGGLEGSLSGAATGASTFGPVGGAVGGVLGGVAGLFGGGGAPKYDPYSTGLQASSYDLYQQAAGLMYPAENTLTKFATNPNAPAQAAQSAIGNVQGQFQRSASARDRLFKTLGYDPTEAQQQSLATQTALSQAQAEAQAANAARQGTYGLQQTVLG